MLTTVQPPYDERIALAQVANGDEKAFAQIFTSYRNKIYTVAYRLTASERNAEEIVQDVFMKVWNKRQSLTEVDNFDSWLFIITRNTVYTFLKSKAAKELHLPLGEPEFLGIASDADLRLHEKEFNQFLQEAVDRLPNQQKLVYRLSKESNLTNTEIAEQLSISQETVKKHLQYAMKAIRAYLISKMDLGILLLILWKIS